MGRYKQSRKLKSRLDKKKKSVKNLALDFGELHRMNKHPLYPASEKQLMLRADVSLSNISTGHDRELGFVATFGMFGMGKKILLTVSFGTSLEFFKCIDDNILRCGIERWDEAQYTTSFETLTPYKIIPFNEKSKYHVFVVG